MGKRALANWLDSYMLYNFNTEPPLLYHKWCGLWTIGAALRRKCFFDWHERVYPNQFILLVGPSGAKKGTALDPVEILTESLNVKVAPDSGSVAGFLDTLATAAKRENEDVDEKGEKIKPCDGNVLLLADEFTVFTSHNNLDLYPIMCKLYECDDKFEHKILSRGGGDYLRNVWLHVLGATTPRSLRDALPEGQAAEGFVARFIVAWGEDKEKWVVDPRKTTKEKALFDNLQEDLLRIEELDGEFTPGPGWFQMYEAWYLGQKNTNPPQDADMAGYWSRRAAHFLKVQMAVSAALGDTMKLTPEVFLVSLSLLEEVERTMPLVFGGYGRLPTSVILPKLAKMVRDATKEKGGIPYLTLSGEFMRDLTKDELDEIIQGWVNLGRVELVRVDGVQLIKFKERIK